MTALLNKGLYHLSVLLLLCVSILSGCAGQATSSDREMPQWLRAQSTQYAAEHYLTGVGRAMNLNDAKDRARADLVKVFEVKIHQQSLDVRRLERDIKGDESVQTLTQVSLQSIATQSEQLRRGIEIVDVWFDEARREYAALAVLKRDLVTSELRTALRQLDAEIEVLMDKAESNDNALLMRASAYHKVLMLLQQRVLPQQYLRALSRDDHRYPSVWQRAELTAALKEVLADIQIVPRLKGRMVADGYQRLGAILSDAGFMRIMGRPEDQRTQSVDYWLDVRLKLETPHYRDRWYWVKGVLDIKLIGAADDSLWGSYHWDIKVSSADADEANRRAQQQANRFLEAELAERIMTFGSP